MPLRAGTTAVQRHQPVVGAKKGFGERLAQLVQRSVRAQLPDSMLQQSKHAPTDFGAARQRVERFDHGCEESQPLGLMLTAELQRCIG
ncbi:hypothetical protein HRbin27_00422 [bacterium HR27]|nr:hypothetical protein HRbin27_00422 [bacterium HR27]